MRWTGSADAAHGWRVCDAHVSTTMCVGSHGVPDLLAVWWTRATATPVITCNPPNTGAARRRRRSRRRLRPGANAAGRGGAGEADAVERHRLRTRRALHPRDRQHGTPAGRRRIDRPVPRRVRRLHRPAHHDSRRLQRSVVHAQSDRAGADRRALRHAAVAHRSIRASRISGWPTCWRSGTTRSRASRSAALTPQLTADADYFDTTGGTCAGELSERRSGTRRRA